MSGGILLSEDFNSDFNNDFATLLPFPSEYIFVPPQFVLQVQAEYRTVFLTPKAISGEFNSDYNDDFFTGSTISIELEEEYRTVHIEPEDAQ